MTLRYFPLIDNKPNTLGLIEHLQSEINIVDIIDDADLLLVAGGDGYMHDCIKKYHMYNKPFFGLNYGTLGFLLNPKDTTIPQKFEDINFVSEKLPQATIKKSDGSVVQTIAVNDVIIGNTVFDYFKFVVKTMGRTHEFRGTGMMVSTSLGSTAYRATNGGPLIPIGAQLLGVSGLSSHPFDYKVFENQIIEVERDTRGRAICNVGVDGFGSGMVQDALSLTIQPGIHEVQLAFHKTINFEAKRLVIASDKILSARTKKL